VRVEKYADSLKGTWDEFVRASKNGTFLFIRDYMDYHRDRFQDHSLIVRDEKDKPIALLPANRKGNLLSSHDGLTYGGFVVDGRMALPLMTKAFEAVIQYLTEKGFRKLMYKTIPYIYHCLPSEEDRCCLFQTKGRCFRRDVLTVIDYHDRVDYQERRSRSIKKAMNHTLEVRETSDYEQFWEFLSENLFTRYGRKPVHTVEEIRLLASRFPDNIKLFASYKRNLMNAGAVLYLSRNVCHVQYNATHPRGKESGALDLLMDYLIRLHSLTHRYFDFGVSSEENGRYLNTGLVEYKEGFGGRTVVHDFYEVDLPVEAKE
jgi:hypothetical protein